MSGLHLILKQPNEYPQTKPALPYLHFSGNCREALAFYQSVFGGEIGNLMTYGQAPMPTSPEDVDKVLHAQLVSGDLMLMASDSMTHTPAPGTNLTMNLNFDSPDEQTRIYDALPAGSQATMPLAGTFWGARFGMLADKYCLGWMLNCG